MYEVIEGLFSKNITKGKILEMTDIFESIKVLKLTEQGILKSAEISSNLIKQGLFTSDCDCLTAGISISSGVDTIVTKNNKHFLRIDNIKVETY